MTCGVVNHYRNSGISMPGFFLKPIAVGTQRIFFPKPFIIILATLSFYYASGQTRNDLQDNNAKGYNNKSGAYRVLLYLPLDTLATSDSGSVAYKGGSLYFKNQYYWIKLVSGAEVVPQDVRQEILASNLYDTVLSNGMLTNYYRTNLPQFIGKRLRITNQGVQYVHNNDDPNLDLWFRFNDANGDLMVFHGWVGTGGEYLIISGY